MSALSSRLAADARTERHRNRLKNRRDLAVANYYELLSKGLRIGFKTWGANEWCFVHDDKRGLVWQGCSASREQAIINAFNDAAANYFGSSFRETEIKEAANAIA